MKYKYQILFLILALFTISCTRKLSQDCDKKLVKQDTTLHYLNTSVKFKYLGCGGFIIEAGNDKILFDPFFSNPSFGKIALGKKLYSDSIIIDKALKNIDLHNINHCFISHAHYDHLMDVPFISKKYFAGKLNIYTNQSGEKALTSKGIQANYIHQINTLTCDTTHAGQWIYLNNDSTCRVMPIVYGHAPHFKFGPIELNFYKGEADSSEFNYSHHWKGGETYAYLIDFMKDGKISNRIYMLAGGASESPLGFIDRFDFFKERKIDVMVLCIASHDNVKNYPQAIIQKHQPEFIIGAHWEDFFVPYFSKKHQNAVRLTNVPRFFNKMEKLGYQNRWLMARPLTQIKFEGN